MAQPPGADPPEGIFGQGEEGEAKGLPIDAFLFLSESGNQVIMPGLTWETIERLIDRELAMEADRQSFSYQELGIKGSAEQARAELEIVLRLVYSTA